MTTEEQIRQLAREYAEAMCPENDYLDQQECEIDKRMNCDNAIDVLRWLCETHCIADKETVLAGYKYAQRFENTSVSPMVIEVFKGQRLLLESLFGKELFNETEK